MDQFPIIFKHFLIVVVQLQAILSLSRNWAYK